MIERRKPIARGKPPKRGKPPRAKGAKAGRERPALDAFRDDLVARSRGYCEAPRSFEVDGDVVEICHSSALDPHDGSDPHHVWPEDRDRGIHDPARGRWFCRAAHRWTHANPKLAKIAGLLRPEVGA